MLPPPIPFCRTDYTILDVRGSRTRDLRGSLHFPHAVNTLPMAPLLVTTRLERRQANPYTVAAYVYGRQVGWLGAEWRRRDPFIRWMLRLDEAGILPRFQGAIRLQAKTAERIIAVKVPGRWDGLSEIAKVLVTQAQGLSDGGSERDEARRAAESASDPKTPAPDSGPPSRTSMVRRGGPVWVRAD